LKKNIYSFKNKDSCGYDETSLKVLKFSTSYISLQFNYICNRILQSGTFPGRLKYSEVMPLHKKGNKQLISNYRPISLLTSFSRIVERVMFNRLVNQWNKHAIINPSQYSFQKDLCTDNAIYALLNEVLTALNNKSKVKGIFCDT
jgi:hypothetical protein